MTKFKIGDRVAVYQNGKRLEGIVGQIDIDGTLYVSGLSFAWWVHVRQCRHLRPKSDKAGS